MDGRKPWEIAWGELRWEEAILAGSKTIRANLLARVFQDKWHQSDCTEKLCAQDFCQSFQTRVHGTCMVDGGEAVGNSLHGRAALGGSETEATTGWTAGKLWEMERRGASSEMEAPDERGLGGGFFGTISINAMS